MNVMKSQKSLPLAIHSLLPRSLNILQNPQKPSLTLLLPRQDAGVHVLLRALPEHGAPGFQHVHELPSRGGGRDPFLVGALAHQPAGSTSSSHRLVPPLRWCQRPVRPRAPGSVVPFVFSLLLFFSLGSSS